MMTARDLAMRALRIANGFTADEFVSFSWQEGLVPGVHKVTLELTDGRLVSYLILEEKERDTPIGESHPR